MSTYVRYHPRELLLEFLPYDIIRPQRDLTTTEKAGDTLMCAGTEQRGMDNQVPCKFKAKVAAQLKDLHGRGEGIFPLCGHHARRRGIFVVPAASLA